MVDGARACGGLIWFQGVGLGSKTRAHTRAEPPVRRGFHVLLKSLVVAVTTTALAAVGVTSAQAVVIPRLAGSFSVKSTITADKNNPGAVGTSSTKTWKFTPSCASGGCNTTLVRPRSSGHPDSVTTTLVPSQTSTGAWQYKGTKTYLSACFLNSGGIVENAYSTKETTTLNVTGTNASHAVTAFKGTLVLVFTPTAKAPSGCTNDKINLKVQSIKKL